MIQTRTHIVAIDHMVVAGFDEGEGVDVVVVAAVETMVSGVDDGHGRYAHYVDDYDDYDGDAEDRPFESCSSQDPASLQSRSSATDSPSSHATIVKSEGLIRIQIHARTIHDGADADDDEDHP